MDTSTITFDQLPHVVIGPSEKLDRSLDLLEKVRCGQPIQTTSAPAQERP